jgi:hypothetical protein
MHLAMFHHKSESIQDISQRQGAILRWDNEGGAGLYGPQTLSATNLALDLSHEESGSRKDSFYEINRRAG